ncbi:transposase [Streptomyces sp. tea 10]|nr:transposase [Streptomyces sp. tea 10]
MPSSRASNGSAEVRQSSGDLGGQRFWRAEMPGVETGGHGLLEDLARNEVNLTKLATRWPDMPRAIGSLATGQLRAYGLLRLFGREGRPTPLGQAFAEYGCIAKPGTCSGSSTRSTNSARSACPDAAVDHLRALPPEEREHDVLDEDTGG